jgi:hypothetical protein
MEPSVLMQGRESDWRDMMRTVVRQVSAHEVRGTWHVTGGGCDGDGVKVVIGGYGFVK